MTEQHNPYTRKPEPFSMFGKNFVYEMLPSIHLRELIVEVVQLKFTVEAMSLNNALAYHGDEKEREQRKEKDKDFVASFAESIDKLLNKRSGQILADVLQYQNSHTVSKEDIDYRVSSSEMAKFLKILLSDPEIKESVEVMIDVGGKLLQDIDEMTAKALAIPKSTLSSPTTSDSPAST